MSHFTNCTVLFDLDGTLTPPRKSIDPDVLSSLLKLSEVSSIGILSGSNYEYITEQLSDLFAVWKKDLHILGCNGTQYYLFNGKDGSCSLQTSVSIKDICSDYYDDIIDAILSMQLELKREFKIPLSGTFIEYRESTLNWCPIGRSASDTDREQFTELDIEFKIRKKYLEKLNMSFEKYGINNITVTLGGETSFDIYPTGWDKTFALQFFDSTLFVGDRCEEGGNDFSICKELKDRCFKTTGPQDTVKIIEDVLIPMLNFA